MADRTNYGLNAFSSSAPHLSNQLSPALQTSPTSLSFTKKLKTFLSGKNMRFARDAYYCTPKTKKLCTNILAINLDVIKMIQFYLMHQEPKAATTKPLMRMVLPTVTLILLH